MVKCPKCGKETKGPNYCTYCGTKLRFSPSKARRKAKRVIGKLF